MRIEHVIGRRIAEAREAKGWTQAKLGEELGTLLRKDPWPRQTVSAAEKGQRAFIASELVAFAVILGVGIESLVTPPIDARDIELNEDGARVTLADMVSAASAGFEQSTAENLAELKDELNKIKVGAMYSATLVDTLHRDMLHPDTSADGTAE